MISRTRELIIKKYNLIFIILMAIFVSSKASFADENIISSYTAEAQIINNFVSLIEWKDDKKKNICIIGDSNLFTKLSSLRNRNYNINKRYKDDFLQDCDMIVVNNDFQGYVEKLLYKVKDSAIVTVGFYKDFAKKGGIIEFEIFENSRVKVSISADSYKRSGISINRNIIAAAIIY